MRPTKFASSAAHLQTRQPRATGIAGNVHAAAVAVRKCRVLGETQGNGRPGEKICELSEKITIEVILY
jgi:hypothetical protein